MEHQKEGIFLDQEEEEYKLIKLLIPEEPSKVSK